MKILINGSELVTAVPWLTKLTNYRVASLGGVMITASDRVSLRSTDTDSFATTTPAATVLDEGHALVSGRALVAVAKELGKSEVTIASDGSTVAIERGKTRWTLPEMNADYFPAFPSLAEEMGQIPGEVLKEGLRQILPAAAPRDVPDAMKLTTGVEFTFGSTLTLAATDRQRIATVDLPWQPTLMHTERVMVIPEALLTLPMSILGTDEVRLHTDGNQIGFVTDRHQVFGRLFDGSFLKWRPLFPDPAKAVTTVTVDTAELLAAVKDASVFSVVTGTKYGDHLNLTFSHDEITVDSCNKVNEDGKDGDGKTWLAPGEFIGVPISIWIQPHYLVAALNVMPGDSTVITFGAMPWNPIVLYGDGGYRHLIGTLKTRSALAWAAQREDVAA